MGDLEVVGHDVVGGDRKRERRAVAGVDPTTERGQGHRDGGLAPGRRLVRAGVEDLHVDQSRDQEQHRNYEDEADETHPPREVPLAQPRR